MKWLSPYQQNSYNEILKDIGIPVFKTHSYHNIPPLYFNSLSSPNLVAWEAPNVEIKERPEKSDIWMFEDVYKYTDMENWNLDNYYSLIIPRNVSLLNYYSSNNKRNIKKAILNNLEYKQIRSKEEINNAASLFKGNENLTGGVDFDTFKILSIKLVESNSAYFHIVKSVDKIIATAITIHSPEVANIRYVASDKEFLHLRPVNFLYDSIINFYLKTDKNCKFVDLSGISAPNSNDEKLLNITRFKRGFSNLVISFRKV